MGRARAVVEVVVVVRSEAPHRPTVAAASRPAGQGATAAVAEEAAAVRLVPSEAGAAAAAAAVALPLYYVL